MKARLKSFGALLFTSAICSTMVGIGSAAFAGTTGGINGVVVTESGLPVAGASVSAVSPTASARSTTDATGHFALLSLLADTYTLTIAKTGAIETTSVGGISVFADQVTRQTIVVKTATRTLGVVHVRTEGPLVRAGSTTTMYSVDSASTDVARDIGGSAYDEQTLYGVAQMVPGFSYHRGYYSNSPSIRGGESDQIGYEFDGIPVNRAFDNTDALNGSIVGVQELQVYTGAEPASAGAQSSSGFVNQVVKSGTYPGSTSMTLSLADPTLYNGLLLESDGATADRRFRYYVGDGSSDIKQREFTQFDGIGLYQWLWGINPFNVQAASWGGDAPPCNPDGQDPFSDPFIPPSQRVPVPTGGNAGCIMFAYPPSLFTKDIQVNRDLVTNVHYALPHERDSAKDDLQLLLATGFQSQAFRTSIFDSGGLKQIEAFSRNYNIVPFWTDSVQFAGTVGWGTQIDPNAPFPQLPIVAYKAPNSGEQFRCADLYIQIPGACDRRADFALIPGDARAGSTQQYGLAKLQFTKNLTSTSFVQVYGYTMYSGSFTGSEATAGSGGLCCYSEYGTYGNDTPPVDFELSTHTRGLTAKYEDQFSPQHLVTVTANYTTASTTNWNNTQATQAAEDLDGQAAFATNLVSFDARGNPTCYIYGYFQSMSPGDIGQPTSCTDVFSRGTLADPAETLSFIPTSQGPESCGPCFAPFDNNVISGGPYNGKTPAEIYATSPAAANGATWIVTDLGAQGTINTVRPVFTSYSISDQWRPTDKLLIAPGLRFDHQAYELAGTDNPDYNFWFANARKYFWYSPVTGLPITCASPSRTVNVDCDQTNSFDGLWASAQCPVATGCDSPGSPVHPDGLNGHLYYTDAVPAKLANTVFEPSIGATFTFDPDTVLKFDVGKGADPVHASDVESLDLSGAQLAAISFGGDYSVAHHLKPRTATNVDFSYERHFKGTDMSLAVTPFYRNTQNLYVSGDLFDTDTYARGIEVAFVKGRLDQDGWTTYLAYTYTDEKMRFLSDSFGHTPVYSWNIFIDNFNSLTRAGDRFGNAGAPCYNAAVNNGAGGPAPAGDCQIDGHQITLTDQGKTDGSVVNPFYFWPRQAYYDPSALYYYNNQSVPTTDPGPTNGTRLDAIGPYQLAGYVSYRHKKLQVAPTFIVWGGTRYGSPLDIEGYDPRACPVNQYGFYAFDPGVLGGGTDAFGNPFLATDAPNPGYPNYIACGSSPLLTRLGVGSVPILPDPYTQRFPGWGEYVNPWHLNLNAIVDYELNSTTRLQLRIDNLYNYCWGGSNEPWTVAYPPNNYICGYQYDPFNNYYYHNGKSPDDQSANGPSEPPYLNQIYAPVVDTWPTNVTFTVQVRL